MEQLFKFNTKFLYFFSLLSFSHFFSPFSFLFSLFSFCKFTVHTYSTSPPFFLFSYCSLLSFLLLLLQIWNFSFLPDISSPLLSGPCLSSISYLIFSLLMSLPLLLPLFLSVSFPWSPSS